MANIAQGVEKNSTSVSIIGLLGIAFVVLKLTGFINWSWWWVTAPFWGGIAIIIIVTLGMIGVALFVAFIAFLLACWTDFKRK